MQNKHKQIKYKKYIENIGLLFTVDENIGNIGLLIKVDANFLLNLRSPVFIYKNVFITAEKPIQSYLSISIEPIFLFPK